MWGVTKGRIVMVVTCECLTSILIYKFNI